MKASPTARRPSLKSKQWVFLDYGLDDFRAGAPDPEKVQLSEEKPPQRFASIAEPPLLNNEEREHKALEVRSKYLGLTKKPKNCGTKLNKQQAVLSKELPRSEQRKNEIREAEEHLKSHPLALYPHLLKAVPVDLTENIGHLLESDIYGDGDEEDDDFDDGNPSEVMPGMDLGRTRERTGTSRAASTSSKHAAAPSTAKSSPANNISKQYRWLVRDEDKKKPMKTAREIEEEESARRLDEVTAEFATWANELSNATPNVDPQTIKSLFASGYESKPALTVPIQVYELTNLPAELRIVDIEDAKGGEKGGPIDTTDSKSFQQNAPTDTEVNPLYRDTNVVAEKKKYGAWYINSKSWNAYYKAPKQDPDEILLERATDPQNVVNQVIKSEISDPNLAAIEKVRMKREIQEQLAQSKDKNDIERETELELAQLNSARLFREYLERQPALKRPDFMSKIINIQDEANKTQ